MMGWGEIVLLAFALAMDCFTVSVVSGVLLRRIRPGTLLRLSLLLGLFQALMPLLGWLAIFHFQASLEAYDHWIAFGMLALIGGKMIFDAFGEEEQGHLDPTRFGAQVLLAVATSIDALAIGISMACTGYSSLGQLGTPLLIIGIVSFLMGMLGQWLGVRFGDVVARRLKPELFGGLILIGIGVKILLEHLLS